jgi:hypothetical protein
MDVAFRLMMFDENVALSFINSFLQEVDPRPPLIAHVSQFEVEVRFREPGRPALNFNAQTVTAEPVVIEIKPRCKVQLDKCAYCRAAAVWIRPGHGRMPDPLYSIRIVDGDPWEGSDLTSIGVRHPGVLVVDVRLRRTDITFPVEEEVGRGWDAAHWWYYFLSFSPQFSDAELDRCRGLGMPAEVVASARKLRRDLWRDAVEESYRNEIEGVEEAVEFRLEMQMQHLIWRFRETKKLADADMAEITEKFSVDFARRIWFIYGDGKDTEMYHEFLGWLRGTGLMSE